MNESKLNMSKLATESGIPGERSIPGDRENNREKLHFSRLEGSTNGAIGPDTDGPNGNHLYAEALNYYSKTYAAIRQDKSFSMDAAVAVTRELIDSLQKSDAPFLCAAHRDYRQDPVIHHSVNVAVFSIMVGNSLGINGSDLVELGLAALFHDIGTSQVPDEIFYKPSALTENELRQLRQRPLFTQQILSKLEEKYAYLAGIAVQVYERVDGSGYPSGLKGRDIHQYAQIIGLVDFYEALIHSRPQRDRFLHFPAIKEILRSGKHSFDSPYLKALINVVSLFPVSSCVRLNSGAIGQVLETHILYPLRPRLKILYDSQGRAVTTERIVNLRENALLYITDAVAEDNLTAAAVCSSGG